MALITCPECKKQISDTAHACPNCGYNLNAAKRKAERAKTSKGCGIGCLAIIVIAIIIALTTGRNGSHNSIPSSGNKPTEKTITYEILKKEKRRGDEAASKQDVLKLAEGLRREHDGKFAHIVIFDSREAWKHQPAMERAALQGKTYKGYSEEDLDRHWLVVIAGDLGQEIRWVAEGRDH